MKNNILPFSQGIKPISISIITTLFISYFVSELIGTFLVFFTFFLIYIYRNNHNEIRRDNSEILSIINGTIEAIDKNDLTTKIYIHVSILDHHHLKAPIDSSMKITNHTNGLNLNPNSFKSTTLNESLDLNFDNIKVNLLSGLCNNKIKIKDTHQVIKGDNLGLFINGIITMILQNNDIKLNVNLGDKVKAGQTVIAFYNQGLNDEK
jgi:phosphatidylserine decarboxylase precursor-related protein